MSLILFNSLSATTLLNSLYHGKMSVGIFSRDQNAFKLNVVLQTVTTNIPVLFIDFTDWSFMLCHPVCRLQILLIFNCQVHCISTEFTMRKHGGEKGVPFRIQIDTFKENESEEYTEHLHSASCQVKVFKVRAVTGTLVYCRTNVHDHHPNTPPHDLLQPKGADRKQKTDREKMEKRAPQEKEKYQPSYETTILTEVSTTSSLSLVPTSCS